MGDEPTTAKISFTITDGTDPINGASVVLNDVTKTTGSAGGCTFDDVADGTYNVVVSKEGYTTKTEEIVIDSEHHSFTIALVAESQETGGSETTEETGGETGGSENTGVTEPTGGETGGSETTEETGGETGGNKFPSFLKAYQYRGGFDKFVYDQLKKLTSSEDEETSGEE